MKLPQKISPCPIIEALIEVRFEPSSPEDAVFGIIYSYLKEKYSKVDSLPILDLPEKVRKNDNNLKYKPYHRLEYKNFVLQIGPRVLSLAVKDEYPGWDSFYSQISWILDKVNTSEIIDTVDRYSLRYINLFKEDIFKKIDLKITLNQEDFNTDETYFKTQIRNGDTRSILQIANNVTLKNNGSNASLIDVDVISTKSDPNFLQNNKKLLDELHVREKKIFFPLLTEEFLSSLNPVY